MSKGWMNIRIGRWHLQGGDPHLWSLSLGRNDYHVENGWPDGWFAVYALFGWRRS